MGPGGDVLLDLAHVMKNKYRGYSYAMSLSPLPDFGTGPRLEEHILGLNLDRSGCADAGTIDGRPGPGARRSVLEPLGDAYRAFNDVDSLLGSMEDLGDIAVQMCATPSRHSEHGVTARSRRTAARAGTARPR